MPRTRRGTSADERFTSSVSPSTDVLSGARERFASWLRERGLTEARRDEVVVVFSELVANGVAASPAASEPVVATAWCDRSDLVLEVTNEIEQASTAEAGWDMDDVLRSGGRGLLLVEAFADQYSEGEGLAGQHRVECRWHLPKIVQRPRSEKTS